MPQTATENVTDLSTILMVLMDRPFFVGTVLNEDLAVTTIRIAVTMCCTAKVHLDLEES